MFSDTVSVAAVVFFAYRQTSQPQSKCPQTESPTAVQGDYLIFACFSLILNKSKSGSTFKAESVLISTLFKNNNQSCPKSDIHLLLRLNKACDFGIVLKRTK